MSLRSAAPAALASLLTIACCWVAPVAQAQSPFAWRGVVEGFYGPPWSHADRLAALQLMGEEGMNVYVYAPKDDPLQRERWAEPYDAAELDRFAELAAAGRAAGVTLGYSLSPGYPLGRRSVAEDSVCYSCPEDQATVVAKYASLMEAGFSVVMLSFDDVQPVLIHPEDVAAFGEDLAAAQSALAAAVMAGLRQRWPGLPLLFVPTEYKGVTGSPYLTSLGEHLLPDAEILWTGPAVLSVEITEGDARAFAAAVGRPPLIWDNYPVNDTTMQAELHLGPLRGRDPELASAVTGLLANPMVQAAPSLIPLHTVAAWLRDPARYQPDAALRRALEALGGSQADGLAAFALQCQHSPLDPADSRALGSAVDRLLRAMPTPRWPEAMAPLLEELASQRAAADALEAALPWPSFFDAARPWWERFAANLDAADQAAALLASLRPGLTATAVAVGDEVIVHGQVRGCDRDAIEANAQATEAAWGEARRIPAQVHGAQLAIYYMAPPGTVEVGGSVVQDLVEGASRAHRRWRPRAAGCEAVTVTVDGDAVPVAAGSFSARLPLPQSGGVPITATDGSGFETTLEVVVDSDRRRPTQTPEAE